MEDGPIIIPPKLSMLQARELSNTAVFNRIRHEAEQEGQARPGFPHARRHADGSPTGDLPRPSLDPTTASVLPRPVRGENAGGLLGAEPLPPVPSSAVIGTSLDTQEASVKKQVEAFLNASPDAPVDSTIRLETSNPNTRFRHSGWWPIRQRIFDAMKRCEVAESRLRRFASCGNMTWIEQFIPDPTILKLRSTCCHDRLCTPCANQRSSKITNAVVSLLDDKGMSFITLTLCGKNEKLTDLIDRLYRHFRALRQHPLWADNVEGGAAFIEVKWSDKAQRWHPHLHIVGRAKFIDQGELSSVWRGISKDSFIVDIRRIKDPAAVGHYVTKYASKPLNTSFSNSPPLLDEALQALHGRRLVMCFGTWYGQALTDFESEDFDEEFDDKSNWRVLVPMETVLAEANSGNADSIAILQSLNAEARWRAALLIE